MPEENPFDFDNFGDDLLNDDNAAAAGEDTLLGELDESPEGEAPDNNRTFMLVAGGMGLLVLLTLICFAVYAFFLAPKQKQEQANQAATMAAQNTQIAAGLTGTAEALSWTTTPLPSPIPTDTPAPSPTPVVVMPSDTPTPDNAYVTATIQAALTQAALAQQTVIPTTTALPGTGFADEVGLPGLMVMALAFVIIILLARRLRHAPVKA